MIRFFKWFNKKNHLFKLFNQKKCEKKICGSFAFSTIFYLIKIYFLITSEKKNKEL